MRRVELSGKRLPIPSHLNVIWANRGSGGVPEISEENYLANQRSERLESSNEKKEEYRGSVLAM